MSEWVLILLLFGGYVGTTSSSTKIDVPTKTMCEKIGKEWIKNRGYGQMRSYECYQLKEEPTS